MSINNKCEVHDVYALSRDIACYNKHCSQNNMLEEVFHGSKKCKNRSKS